jgi:Na+/H+ antiporter NhaD/arsenite permease-like protein
MEETKSEISKKIELKIKKKFGLKFNEARPYPLLLIFGIVIFGLGLFVLFRGDYFLYPLGCFAGSILMILLSFRADIQGRITKFQIIWEVMHKGLYLIMGLILIMGGISCLNDQENIPIWITLIMLFLGITISIQTAIKIVDMIKHPEIISGKDKEWFIGDLSWFNKNNK